MKFTKKERTNRLRGKMKNITIKRLNAKPVLFNVDVQAIKKQFAEEKAAKKTE